MNAAPVTRRCTAAGCGASQPEGHAGPRCYWCRADVTTVAELGSFDGDGASLRQCNWCDRAIPPREKLVSCNYVRHHDRPREICEVCAGLGDGLGLLLA